MILPPIIASPGAGLTMIGFAVAGARPVAESGEPGRTKMSFKALQ